MKTTPTVRLEFRARYLPYVVGLLSLLQLVFPYKGWMILLVILGGAWLVSYLWARSLARGLELKREMRYGWAQVGDHLQERFTLTNRGRAPAPWVAITDHSTLPGYQVSSAIGVGQRAVKHWFEEGVCARRGLYTLGPTGLRTGDPCGFYSVSVEYPTSLTMTVMPPIIHLPTIDVAPAGQAGEGRHSAPALEEAVHTAGVREFLPGDSLRRIHWPTTARRDEPFVRLFDSAPESNWWIVLDMDQRVQAGTGEGATEEHGVILAASLADRGLHGGKAVGLVVHGQELVWLPPKLGADQCWDVLRALALLRPGRCSLAELLASAGSGLRQRCGLVIITPDVEGRWLDPLVRLVRRGLVPTVLLLDRGSFEGAQDGARDSSRDAPADAQPGLGQTQATLQSLDITHYVIPPDLLDRPEARPGRVGHWERMPQGRWEPSFHPRELVWRALT
jgi:uncharacterized protein (DUF58 family)